MTGSGVKLSAHEGYGMVGHVEKAMQPEGSRDIRVIPPPNIGPVPALNCFASNVPWNAEIRQVQISDTAFRQVPFKIALREIGLVHAHRICSDVYQALDSRVENGRQKLGDRSA